MKKKLLSTVLAASMLLSLTPWLQPAAQVSAKTVPNGETIHTALFYAEDGAGQRVLVSQIPTETYDKENQGLIVHNYSLLDRYVTTLHQEATGLTVPDFVAYAGGKSEDGALRSANLHFAGDDQIAFWEIDQTGYDDMDTYTYNDLYGTPRYNFPRLYQYWNYVTQDYYDPAGVMTREQVVDYIWEGREPETMLLSSTAFSQRFMITEEKYDNRDYNMENYWSSNEYLDTARSIRMMIPMTEEDLRSKTPTASNSRYWVSQILLKMKDASAVRAQGTVAAPTAVLTEDDDNYYLRLFCDTPGATIYFNHNYQSPSYMPTYPYAGEPVQIPKENFRSGTVTMTVHAVRDGFADAGVKTLSLTASGLEKDYVENGGSAGEQPLPFTDLADNAWYLPAVREVVSKGYFNGTGDTTFSPEGKMTRAMFVTVLGRMAGVDPAKYAGSDFSDVPEGQWFSAYVKWASDNQVVNGIGGGKFAPNAQVTREQMAAILYRYAGYAGADTTASDARFYSFADYAQVSTYAKQAMAWAVDRKVINGTGAGLDPKADATRAQVAQIIYNAREVLGSK